MILLPCPFFRCTDKNHIMQVRTYIVFDSLHSCVSIRGPIAAPVNFLMTFVAKMVGRSLFARFPINNKKRAHSSQPDFQISIQKWHCIHLSVCPPWRRHTSLSFWTPPATKTEKRQRFQWDDDDIQGEKDGSIYRRRRRHIKTFWRGLLGSLLVRSLLVSQSIASWISTSS